MVFIRMSMDTEANVRGSQWMFTSAGNLRRTTTEEDEIDAIGFSPKAVIGLESRHSKASHVENYRLGKELAKIVGGVIYDHQVAVVYDAEGVPCGHCGTDEKPEDNGQARPGQTPGASKLPLSHRRLREIGQ
jgi:hypothetical protein